jgi:hypothetical protein
MFFIKGPHILELCYGLDVSVSHPIHILVCVGIWREGLWKIIRVQCDHKVRTLMIGLVP